MASMCQFQARFQFQPGSIKRRRAWTHTLFLGLSGFNSSLVRLKGYSKDTKGFDYDPFQFQPGSIKRRGVGVGEALR